MNTPSAYISDAVRRLRATLKSDCVETLTAGACRAEVVRVNVTTRGDEDISGDSPTENLRVLAVARELESVTKGDVVTLGNDSRLVTSVRVDPAGASLRVGLTLPLVTHEATVSGMRGQRRIRFTVGALAVRNGLVQDFGDGYAPTSAVESWTLCVAFDEWSDATSPQIGDEFNFYDDGRAVKVRVSKCDKRDRHFTINARSR